MAEIIRPFLPPGGNPILSNQPNTSPAGPPPVDPKIMALRMEIEKLESQRGEVLAKYEETRRALEKQRHITNSMLARLQRSEQLLGQEQTRLRKSQEIIGTYQKQWGQMVENDKKLRTALAEMQTRLKTTESERGPLLDSRNSALAELQRVKPAMDQLSRAHGELQLKYQQIQEILVTMEREADENRHKSALLGQELEGARVALASAEKNQSSMRHDLSDARFRIEQLKREVELLKMRGHELEKLCQETLSREEKCRATIATLTSESADLATALKHERSALVATKQKLADAERACEQLIQDRASLVRRGDEAYAEVNRLNKKVDEITATARKTEDALTSERDDALQSIARLEAELTTSSAEAETKLANARGEVEAAIAEITRLRSECQALQQALESERLANKVAREDVLKAERLYEQLMKDRADLVKRGDAAYEEVARLNRKLEEAIGHGQQMADGIKVERDSALATVAHLEFELANARNEHRRMEQERIEISCQQDALKGEVERLEQEIALSRDTLREREESEHTLRDELQAAQNLIHQLTENRARLAEGIDEARAETREARNSLTLAQEELRVSKGELENLKAAFSQANERSQQLEQERNSAQGDLAKTKDLAEKMRRELNEVTHKMKSTDEELKKKLVAAENAKDALWEELVQAERNAEQAELDSARYRTELEFLKRTPRHPGVPGNIGEMEARVAEAQLNRSKEEELLIKSADTLKSLLAEEAAAKDTASDDDLEPKQGQREDHLRPPQMENT